MEGGRRQLQQTAVTAGRAVHGRALSQHWVKGNWTSATPLKESLLVSAGRFFSLQLHSGWEGGCLFHKVTFLLSNICHSSLLPFVRRLQLNNHVRCGWSVKCARMSSLRVCRLEEIPNYTAFLSVLCLSFLPQVACKNRTVTPVDSCVFPCNLKSQTRFKAVSLCFGL